MDNEAIWEKYKTDFLSLSKENQRVIIMIQEALMFAQEHVKTKAPNDPNT